VNILKKLKVSRNFIFDCDGVILNSNHIKTSAFFNVLEKYGAPLAKKLQNYHIANGGISRYDKFNYFFQHIINRKPKKNEMETILENFSYDVKKQLLVCDVEKSLGKFREYTNNSNWFVVSGGDQEELREIFKKRNISYMFNGGIYGSPRNKNEIMLDLTESGKVSGSSIFIGDSEYDARIASDFKLDFIFLSQWTEVIDWQLKFPDSAFKNLEALMTK